MKTNTILDRKDVPAKDKWNLSSLYNSDSEWEQDLKELAPLVEKIVQFKGKLATSSEILLNALKTLEQADLKLETIYNYASLIHSADENDSAAKDKLGRAMMAYTDFSEKTSFFEPELLAIEDFKINEWKNLCEFSDYKIFIEKTLHSKPHILSEKEERILSLQGQCAQTAESTYSVLENVDLNAELGTVETPEGTKPLTASTFVQLLHHKDQNVRKAAYKQYYAKFENYQNTIASLYAGSVNQDVFVAKARNYNSSLEAALYSNKVPQSVYTNLIECVHKNLPALHKYYALRKKVLGLKELHHYDVYVPIVKDVEMDVPYEQAVEICRNALSPLGTEYTDRLCNGLLNGWADRYENKGKRSGAFSSGTYKGDPFILLNYKSDLLRDVYTMAHEGGHSMHSWYSVHNNPYMQYNYTIFEAEVASTFNEQLVFEYLLKNAKDDKTKAFLLSMRVDDVLATLHRQTMFAEYELKTHQLVESGTPLTAELLRKTYRDLLELYFGPEMHFEENSDLESFRIPHFYTAFYVYKYATGISAAMALAQRVLNGGTAEREDYFKFLKSGGSRYPIESLKVAGVDMESTEPVQSALNEFAKMVDQLEKILK